MAKRGKRGEGGISLRKDGRWEGQHQGSHARPAEAWYLISQLTVANDITQSEAGFLPAPANIIAWELR